MIDFLFQEDNASYPEQRGADSGEWRFRTRQTPLPRDESGFREQLDRLLLKLLFVESVCTDEAIIDRNIWQAKVNNEDYRTEAGQASRVRGLQRPDSKVRGGVRAYAGGAPELHQAHKPG